MDQPINLSLLGDGPLHQELARQLGLSITTRPDSSGSALVVVAEQASDVQAIVRAKAWLTIAAVITWRLPESALLRLLDLEVPVFIGLPDPRQFRQIVEAGADVEALSAERRRTARLAVVEAALTARGRADEMAGTQGVL
jgi:hypothetical protein